MRWVLDLATVIKKYYSSSKEKKGKSRTIASSWVWWSTALSSSLPFFLSCTNFDCDSEAFAMISRLRFFSLLVSGRERGRNYAPTPWFDDRNLPQGGGSIQKGVQRNFAKWLFEKHQQHPRWPYHVACLYKIWLLDRWVANQRAMPAGMIASLFFWAQGLMWGLCIMNSSFLNVCSILIVGRWRPGWQPLCSPQGTNHQNVDLEFVAPGLNE